MGCFQPGFAERGEDQELTRLIGQRKFDEALAFAVRARKNIIVSGGTSTGKTTFLNALLREIPGHLLMECLGGTQTLADASPASGGCFCRSGARNPRDPTMRR